jgi:hypothetical protein
MIGCGRQELGLKNRNLQRCTKLSKRKIYNLVESAQNLHICLCKFFVNTAYSTAYSEPEVGLQLELSP